MVMTDEMVGECTTSSLDGSDLFHRIELPDADIQHYAALFSTSEADRLFLQLRREIDWQQEYISLYGTPRAVPRLTAWYGEPGTTYTYSGIRHKAASWLPVLQCIRQRIERVSCAAFNSVLLNFYRDGADSVAWHADDEPELGRNPVIGSVSFGASRVFQVKHKRQRALKHAIALEHGSYLLMQGATQHHWLHQVPKTRGATGERINLTYRRVM
jgi:alkylated DNA repair dioxygenase AlkB